MGIIAYPKAHMIAETRVIESGMRRVFDNLGIEWESDADDDASLLVEFAGKSCYMSFDTSLNKNLTRTGGRNNYDYIQKGIIANRHGSVLEHASVTFYLADVSRVVTHELVRHRTGTAFSQTSGRYVRTDQVDMYIPSEIMGSPGAMSVWKRATQQMEDNLRDLAIELDVASKPFSIKKRITSAIRRLIGNGQANNIVVTANHRAWRHMIETRTDPSAEEEIRVVFAQISQQLRAKFPAIYGDAAITTVDMVEVTKFEHSKV